MAETATGGALDPAVLHRVHLTRGRARLRLRDPMGRAALQALIERLSGLAGVTRVVARPNTGSIILYFDGPGEAMMDRLAEAGGIAVADPPKPPPVDQLAKLGLLRLDTDIRTRTGEALDFRTALALVLLFMAIVQLGRGRIAGPTTTLLMSALSLLGDPKAKERP